MPILGRQIQESNTIKKKTHFIHPTDPRKESHSLGHACCYLPLSDLEPWMSLPSVSELSLCDSISELTPRFLRCLRSWTSRQWNKSNASSKSSSKTNRLLSMGICIHLWSSKKLKGGCWPTQNRQRPIIFLEKMLWKWIEEMSSVIIDQHPKINGFW